MTTAETSAALTGLLFVAASVIPRRAVFAGSPVIQQVRAAAALLSFLNALTVSMFTLVPGTNVGYPAAILAVIGLLFTAAAFRSIITSVRGAAQRVRQLGLVIALLAIFGVELVAGIIVIGNPADINAMETIGYTLVALVIAGVARAWELVGERDTGILASLAILTGHESVADEPTRTSAEPHSREDPTGDPEPPGRDSR